MFLAAFLLLFISSPYFVFSQTQEVFETKTGIEYLAYFPEEYKKDNSAPLLLFLHGLGEKGNNIEKVKKFGPPHMIKTGTWPEKLPFVVISPQLPGNYNSWPTHLIDDILEEILEKHAVNEQRIYLTGLSLGGIATWKYATQHPEKLAAIIPICGSGNPESACKLQGLPVWAFHGNQDGIVKPEGSIKMIEALKKCKNRTAEITKFTLYPGVKHNSWTVTYNNLDIYKWLLLQKNENVPVESINNSLKSFKDEATEEKITKSEEINIKIVSKLPVSISESSGLQFISDGHLWTHNDSGNQPVIYQIDTTGKINKFITITNATNYDWEDLAKDEEGNLYIGDFGNNQNNRKSLQIYKISNPEKFPKDRMKAEVIEFSYSDQSSYPPLPSDMNFDSEAMIVFKNNIYIFSKNNTKPFSGYVKMYCVPNVPGKYSAELLDSLLLDTSNILENVITGADISPDQKKIALLTYNKVILLSNYKGADFFRGDRKEISLSSLSQKEGITFINNTEAFITDERFKNIFGGTLYLINLSPFIEK